MVRYLLVVLVLAFVACNSSDKPKNVEVKDKVEQLVPFDSLSFTLTQPKGWDYKIGVMGSDLLMMDNSCDSCLLKPVIAVIKFANKDSLSLERVVEDHLKSTESYFQNFTLLKQEPIDLNGLPSQRIVYTAVNNQKDSIGAISYLVLRDEKVYFINCTEGNTGGSFHSKINFFDEICQSFSFKDTLSLK